MKSIKGVKVVSRANLPTSLPLVFSCVLYLMMDKFHAPDWVQGAVWTVMCLLWIVCITAMINQKMCAPVFEEEK